MVPSFQQAAMVPQGVYKTCLDAWDSYHSILIAEEDWHITTFSTP